jgi:hypothetical protein
VAVFTSLPAGLTEVYAKVDGFSPFIEKTTLRPGENTQTATLSPTDVESGS